MDAVVLTVAQLGALLEVLQARGDALLGPTVRDGAIVVDRITGLDQLPRGVGDEQAPGRYRLRERGDEALFGWAAPASSAKHELFRPRAVLVQLRRRGRALEVTPPAEAAPAVAFVGLRPCDVAAIAVQDRVLRGARPDPDYDRRRAASFVLAVDCGTPSSSCFCASMGTGPRAEGNFDLAATELFDPHRFLVRVGSPRGAEVLAAVCGAPATAADHSAADAVDARARAAMTRSLDGNGLPAALQAAAEHPRWAEVADVCLACGACTMACPTCFCSTIEDTTDLDGTVATRTRRWDSCFTGEFAHLHGGTVRPSVRARYRQWLTHKLSTWHDQFGTSGCVGCGRCITWCPAAIDLTAEAAALRAPAARPT